MTRFSNSTVEEQLTSVVSTPEIMARSSVTVVIAQTTADQDTLLSIKLTLQVVEHSAASTQIMEVSTIFSFIGMRDAD